jgi:hypothetical protein
MLTLEAISVGCRAVPADAGPMRVLAVFERSMLLVREARVLALGSPAIGRGPLNVLVSDEDWLQVAAVNGDWSCDRSALRADGILIRLDRAGVWQPPPWPRVGDLPGLMRARALLEAASRSAPTESLVHAAVDVPIGSVWPGQSAASAEVRFLRRWLRDGGPPPLGLVGLGPGATPAGDDLLAGVLVTLAALGDAERRIALGTAINACALQRTSPLSAALLKAAADGLAGEDLSAAISALVSADVAALPDAIVRAARHGATSGWDSLGGAAMALAVVSAVASSEY